MPLIDLKTNLKDLKFGKDQYRGGDSGQPFVSTRIPATDEPLQTTVSISGPDVVQTVGSSLLFAGAGAAIGSILGPAGTVAGAAVGLGIGLGGNIDQGNSVSVKFPTAGTGGPDFLLRGGSLVANYVADDYNRLSKFFKGTNGVLFTLKQNLLSRLGTRAQGAPLLVNERLYAPLSTILGAVGSPFGLHVNKQGLNPFQGIGDSFTPDRYLTATITGNNDPFENNRLIGLYNYILVNNATTNNFGSQRIAIYDGASTNVLSYSGGPGSFLGIGRTNIRFATNNLDSPLTVREAPNFYQNTLSYEEISKLGNSLNDTAPVTNVEGNFGTGAWNVANGYIVQRDFRQILRNKKNNPGNIPDAPRYTNGSPYILENRTNLGNPGATPSKNVVNYYYGYGGDINISYGAASPNSYDKINALPIYRYDSATVSPNVNPPDSYSDLINFRIGVISNDNIGGHTNNVDYIHFRAFLDKISDSYKADWKDIKYIGRGESFYSYSGFDRKVSLSWTVAAQSKVELIPMYKKLNYLSSLCAPDYSEYGYMRGNIVKLTIGGYFYEQPGIITGFSYNMNEDNDSWEIGIDTDGAPDRSVRQLPHIVRVSNFDFIPIHEFVPRKQKLKFAGSGSDPGVVSVYGKERFISLKDENKESLYEIVQGSGNPFDSIKQDTTLYDGFFTGLPYTDTGGS